MTVRLLASSSVAALMLAGLAHAQTTPTPPAGGGGTPTAPSTTATAQVEEVVVTANKTGAQALQKTAEAVSVINGAQLQAQGLRNIKDVATYIPDFSFAQAPASAEIYIRGIGSNNTQAGSDPDVVTEIDGVYIARPSGQLTDFIDVNDIEVLRGPQGTLYGRNAVGGVISISSLPPSHEFKGQVAVTGGNYDLGQFSGYVTGPLINDVYGSVALNYVSHDGYFKDIAPGGESTGSANHGGIKGQIRWEPLANLDATTRADLELGDDREETWDHPIEATKLPAPLANSLVGGYRDVALNLPQPIHTQFDGLSEEVNWRFAPAFSLKSITAFRDTYYKFQNDNDATELNLLDLQIREHDKQYSQELDLQYHSPRLVGVGGLYFFHDEDHETPQVAEPPSVITPAARSILIKDQPQVDSTNGAIFAQATYNLTDQLSLVAGARYTGETKSFHTVIDHNSLNPSTPGINLPGFPTAFSLSNDYYAFTPKGGINYQLTRDILFYFSVTKGYKSGGFNYSAASPVGAAFKPEKITSYEGGAKTEWLDHRLRVNITGFHYDYTDLQVAQQLAPGVQSIGNAASATINGVELEVVAKPTPHLQLTGNLSGLDAHYEQYNAASVPSALVGTINGEVCTAGPTGTTCSENASGNKLDSAPDYSGLVAADYTWDVREVGVTAHLDYAFRGRTYFDPSNVAFVSQHAYGLLNAHLGFTSPDRKWEVEFYGKNLTDKGYFIDISASAIVPEGLAGDPRTYGVRVSRSF